MGSDEDALLYAELLPNIRQLTVCACLDNPPSATAKVALNADRDTFSLRDDGKSASLTLPSKVSEAATLALPSSRSNELSFRLPLASFSQDASSVPAEENVVPWSASLLSSEAEIRCQECASVLVSSGTIQSWKDLPSDDWAEMMDFWHCHKPPAPKGSEENGGHVGAAKGYAASNKVKAERGVGLVHLNYFLLFETDCSGTTVCKFLDLEYYTLIPLSLHPSTC